MTTRLRLLIALLLGACSPPPSVEVGETEQAVNQCPGAVVAGNDVSRYQGGVNWGAVQGAGRRFMIAKATEGTGYIDAQFKANWNNSAAAGVIRGAYHFFRANLDGVAQANYFLNELGPIQPGDLPPMLDLETTDGQSAGTILARARAWLDRVEQVTGRAPMLYTYPSFWLSTLGNPGGFGHYPLVMASYGPCPPVPASWSGVTIWQFTDADSVPGIAGNVDGDRFYGDLVDLQVFASGHIVMGAIRAEYRAIGGANALGFAITDELTTPDTIGRFNHFQRGSIYWTPATGAHEVHGAIRDKWSSLGWETSALGYPITDETVTPDGVGRFNHFEHGSIYWTPATDAHAVQGAIRDEWQATGWETGPLGYPIGDETATPDGVGRYNHFEHGSIYWTPATGAHAVQGAIRDKWASLGWEQSALGYPISDEHDVPGGRQSDFQHGALFWDVATGVVSVVMPATSGEDGGTVGEDGGVVGNGNGNGNGNGTEDAGTVAPRSDGGNLGTAGTSSGGCSMAGAPAGGMVPLLLLAMVLVVARRRLG